MVAHTNKAVNRSTPLAASGRLGVRDNDGRNLDHKTLEVLRLRAVDHIGAGSYPENVSTALGMARCTCGWRSAGTLPGRVGGRRWRRGRCRAGRRGWCSTGRRRPAQVLAVGRTGLPRAETGVHFNRWDCPGHQVSTR